MRFARSAPAPGTPAFPAWTGAGQDAILQPPKPEIPSPPILQRVMDRDADREAAERRVQCTRVAFRLVARGCPQPGFEVAPQCRR
jgi:hypothetical protein